MIQLKLKPKTPRAINAAVKKLVRTLKLTTTPLYLKLTNVKGTRAGYCFNDCEDYVEQNGGEVVYGWMIWEDRKNEFIEAEFHAVVKINDRLIDITPRVNLEKEILFVEDNIRRSGRESFDAWFSYRNIKFQRDNIVSHPKQILIKELDDINSEIVDFE